MYIYIYVYIYIYIYIYMCVYVRACATRARLCGWVAGWVGVLCVCVCVCVWVWWVRACVGGCVASHPGRFLRIPTLLDRPGRTRSRRGPAVPALRPGRRCSTGASLLLSTPFSMFGGLFWRVVPGSVLISIHQAPCWTRRWIVRREPLLRCRKASQAQWLKATGDSRLGLLTESSMAALEMQPLIHCGNDTLPHHYQTS